MDNVKVKLEVLDPTGVVREIHEFEYEPAYYNGRGLLTIGEYQYMVTGCGKTVRRIIPPVLLDEKLIEIIPDPKWYEPKSMKIKLNPNDK